MSLKLSYPTFFFGKTPTALITSTTPLLHSFYSNYEKETIRCNYNSSIQAGIWYPKVEFIITQIINGNTLDLSLKLGQLLPFNADKMGNIYNSNIDSSPVVSLIKDANINQGGFILNMEDLIVCCKAAQDLYETGLSDYFKWYNEVGKGNITKFIINETNL